MKIHVMATDAEPIINDVTSHRVREYAGIGGPVGIEVNHYREGTCNVIVLVMTPAEALLLAAKIVSTVGHGIIEPSTKTPI